MQDAGCKTVPASDGARGGTDCKNGVYTSPQDEKAAISGGGIDGKKAAYLLLCKNPWEVTTHVDRH
jgi:hypothetical protein